MVSQHSKTKQNAKTALVQLVFLINAQQNANQKPIRSAPAYRAQCTLPPQPIYQTLLSIFRESGSETTFILYSLAWPDPSRSRKGEEEKGGGEKEEGSGDSEQDVVTSANMAAEPIRLQ